MTLSELSENKKPRFYNRGFFATPTEQAVLPRPTYILNGIFRILFYITKIQPICYLYKCNYNLYNILLNDKLQLT